MNMNEQCYPKNIEEIKKFAEDIGIDVKYLLGKKWKGDLFLGFVRHVPAHGQFNVDGCLGFIRVDSIHSSVVFNVSGKVKFEVFVTSVKQKVEVIW
jgi:hypothetical protein